MTKKEKEQALLAAGWKREPQLNADDYWRDPNNRLSVRERNAGLDGAPDKMQHRARIAHWERVAEDDAPLLKKAGEKI